MVRAVLISRQDNLAPSQQSCAPLPCAGGGGRKAGNGLILVFDFGGGTLDVSMLGLSDGVFVTLAIAGMTVSACGSSKPLRLLHLQLA